MVSPEQYQQMLIECTLKKDSKDRGICPLTNKTVTENRCIGQMSLRMMGGDLCNDVCLPALDDLKIRRYGGRSSVCFDPPPISTKEV